MNGPLLSLQGVNAHYGEFQALFDLALKVGTGECVALVGSNGAGKSTLLKVISGLISPSAGHVDLGGKNIGGVGAEEVVRRGVALVPEGRRLFPSLTVEENLLMGAQAKRKGPWSLERIYHLFPNIAERKRNLGGALSGGQQQMVAIGRALMTNPDLLLCDEISLGLAPVVVRELYDRMALIRSEGMAVVIVEQDIGQASKVATRLYCLRSGRVVLEGAPTSLTRQQITDAYFGLETTAHGHH